MQTKLAKTPKVPKVKVINPKKLQFAKELYEAVDNVIDISSAFIWEGSSSFRVDAVSKISVNYLVGGSSSVEHEGDVDNIRSNVDNLRRKTAEIKIGKKSFKITIDDATCSVTRGEQYRDDDSDDEGDGDYTVICRGMVTISFSKM